MVKEQSVVDKLTSEERKDLRQCETFIRKGVKTFVEVGTALKEIQDRQLYREKYSTFDEYCKQRWSMSRSYAYRLINSVEVVKDLESVPEKDETDPETLSPQGDTPEGTKTESGVKALVDKSVTEKQMRPLKQLRNAQARREVWEAAKEVSGGNPSSKVVTELVKEKLAEDAEVMDSFDISKLRVMPDSDGIATWMWEPVNFGVMPPELLEDRLAAVLHSRPPINSEDAEDHATLICPGHDLFAAAVPDAVIERILDEAEKAPHWTFLIISKNYLRLFSYKYPKNIWVGAQVTTSNEFLKAEAAALSGKAGMKFLYCCPLSDEIVLTDDTPFKWCIICGSDPQPKAEHVITLTASASIPVLWAESLVVRMVGRP